MAESISAKTAWALAKAIKGGSKKKLPNSGTATVVRVDQDGTHWVRISGSDVETPVNGAITADAKPGDVVQYRLEDTRISITGNATSPSVGKEYVNDRVEPLEAKVGVVAKANELLNTATERARSVADAAQAVANAVNQHFFADGNGIHVTEATQDEWEANHSGANVLINSIGQLFRDGLNNLLAILTSGVVIYDGNGNDEENVVASFMGDEINLGDFRISSLDLGPSLHGGWLYSDSMTLASAVSQSAGIMTNGVHVGDGSVDANVTDRTAFGYRIPIESGGSVVGYDTASAQKTARETFAWYRAPVGTYTGANNTGTASAAGWQLTHFNVVVAEHGSPRTYDYTFSNGVLTARRDCVLEISGVMNWTDEIAGRRGFGVFEGTTVGSGTEHSVFQSFEASLAGNRKSVVFPPRLFTLSAGSSLTFGRNQQQNAVYVNGYNYSWVTVRVVG